MYYLSYLLGIPRIEVHRYHPEDRFDNPEVITSFQVDTIDNNTDSLRNIKRRNKGNFTLKSNSNKIKLCGGGGGGQNYLALNKI